MTRESRHAYRNELLSRVPRWYSPWGHLALPGLAGLALVALALSRLEDLRAWQLALVPVFLALGNAIEWHAHRGLLHRRTRFLEVLYVRHTPQHHGVFTADDMAIRSPRELKLVLLPAYGVLAIFAVSFPVAFAFAAAGQPNLAALWVASVVTYVLAYEWLHLAYHLPETHPVSRLRAIRRLRRHHQLHHAPHLMQRWNFNVTLPLWDHVKGTVHRGHPAQAPAGARPAAR